MSAWYSGPAMAKKPPAQPTTEPSGASAEADPLMDGLIEFHEEIVFRQGVDCCAPGSAADTQELVVRIEDGGGGGYAVISTERFAFDAGQLRRLADMIESKILDHVVANKQLADHVNSTMSGRPKQRGVNPMSAAQIASQWAAASQAGQTATLTATTNGGLMIGGFSKPPDEPF